MNMKINCKILAETSGICELIYKELTALLPRLRLGAKSQNNSLDSPLTLQIATMPLILQAAKCLRSSNVLLYTHLCAPDPFHFSSVTVLQRSIFDGLMRLGYLLDKNNTDHNRALKLYIGQGVIESFHTCLDNFFKNNVKDDDLAQEIKDLLDANWFNEKLTAYRINKTEIYNPIQFSMKNECQYDENRKLLLSEIEKHAEGEGLKYFRKNKNYLNMESKEPTYKSNLWPTSIELYTPAEKVLTQVVKLQVNYDFKAYCSELFSYCSSYIHPNIATFEDPLSNEEPSMKTLRTQLFLCQTLIILMCFLQLIRQDTLTSHFNKLQELEEIITDYE